jgi:flagellum-specific peptidoglycan hydrolase FlgJ
MHKWKVPASVSLAQWALESAYGKHMPAGSNNPFGMKAVTGQAFVTATTHEVVKGKTITVQAKFRKFSSIADAFDAHGQLLATKPVYAKAMLAANDADKFADALTGVYATDPSYGHKLKQIMKQFDLYRFNH